MSNEVKKKKKINCNKKGKRGEREWAEFCRDYGFLDARRSQQYCGTENSADVIGPPLVHFEVKRDEHLNVYTAMEKARQDAGTSGNIPILAWRKNSYPWLVTMSAKDWFKFYTKYVEDKNATNT